MKNPETEKKIVRQSKTSPNKLFVDIKSIVRRKMEPEKIVCTENDTEKIVCLEYRTPFPIMQAFFSGIILLNKHFLVLFYSKKNCKHNQEFLAY